MTLDPRERELLAEFLGVAVVCFDVDRALEEERFVQSEPAITLFPARSAALRTNIETPVMTDTVIQPSDTQPTSVDYATPILLGLREHDAPADDIAYVKRRIITSNAALASDIENL